MMTDSLAFFLTRIRNATRARHKKVDIPASRIRVALVEILKEQGFIRDYRLFRDEGKGVVRVYLKYLGKGKPIIQGLKRVSKPSRRIYRKHDDIPKILGGLGIAIISTSKGIMTDNSARENKVGGEVLCAVW